MVVTFYPKISGANTMLPLHCESEPEEKPKPKSRLGALFFLLLILLILIPGLAIAYSQFDDSEETTVITVTLHSNTQNTTATPSIASTDTNHQKRAPISFTNTRYGIAPSCAKLHMDTQYNLAKQAAQDVLSILPVPGSTWAPMHHALQIPALFNHYFPSTPAALSQVHHVFRYLSAPESFTSAGPGFIYCSEHDPALSRIPAWRHQCHLRYQRQGAYSGNYDERHAHTGFYGQVVVVCDGTKEEDLPWVVLHEMTHNKYRGFLDVDDMVVPSAQKGAYGRVLAGMLRVEKPEWAVRNADSYAMFAKEVHEMKRSIQRGE